MRSSQARRRLILASASRARQRLLEQAGLEFEVRAADVDEAGIREDRVRAGQSPAEVALALARAKAEASAGHDPKELVIGADQILVCETRWLEKPGSPEAMRTQLEFLSGRCHELVSGLCVYGRGSCLWQHVEQANLIMWPLSPAVIEAYIERAGPGAQACVGGYEIEGCGIQLFDRIEGDYFTILGLPLLPLLRFLREQGVLD